MSLTTLSFFSFALKIIRYDPNPLIRRKQEGRKFSLEKIRVWDSNLGRRSYTIINMKTKGRFPEYRVGFWYRKSEYELHTGMDPFSLPGINSPKIIFGKNMKTVGMRGLTHS